MQLVLWCILAIFMVVVQCPLHFSGSQTPPTHWWLYIILGWTLWVLPSVAERGVSNPPSSIAWGLHAALQVLKLEGIFWRYLFQYLFPIAGEVISALRDTGLLKKTIVIFTADHGELAMEHRQFYKMSMYEGSSHVPLLVMGPGIKKQQQVPNVVSLVDIYPTMLGELSHFKWKFFSQLLLLIWICIIVRIPSALCEAT